MEDLFKTHLHSSLLAAVEIPMQSFVMDWEDFSSQFSKRLGLENVYIRPVKTSWLAPEELEKTLGENLIYISLILSPLNGHVFWAMDQDDISKITSWLLFKTSKAKGFSSEILQDGFYRYLLLEGLDLIDQNPALQGLSAKIISAEPSLQSAMFGVDIEITYQERSCYARLYLTSEFLSSWKQKIKPTNLLEDGSSDKIHLPVSVIAGKVSLSMQEWEQIQPGDFVLLDTPYFDFETQQKKALLSVKEIPLFYAKIKPAKMKVIDCAPFNERFMEENSEEKNIPLKEIPLSIHVEMGSFQMSLQRLMNVKPGEVIDFPNNLEHDVTLTLSGKPIGKGELVKIGETYGVRVLEIH